jgi:hypothetical protein
MGSPRALSPAADQMGLDQSFSAPIEGITCWAARYMQMKTSMQQVTLAGSIGAGGSDWHGSN